MTETRDDAERIARGIEAAFRQETDAAYARREGGYGMLAFFREKLGQLTGATTHILDLAEATAVEEIERQYAERLAAIKAKRPETYAGYGLDCTRFDEHGLLIRDGENLVSFDE